jgi:PE family
MCSAAVEARRGAGMVTGFNTNTDPAAVGAENRIRTGWGSTSGYYEFDEAGFTNAINQVQACIDKVRELRVAARPMTQVLPMGDEPSSRRAAEGINASGGKYLTHNKALENAYQVIHDDLVAAREAYLAQEHHATDAINAIQRNM